MTRNCKLSAAGRIGLALAALAACAQTNDWGAELNRVSAQALKGHVSFLASDMLEGRNTPSRGLDIAAEYIAAQFRAAGLEPGGDDGYFQTARWFQVTPVIAGFRLWYHAATPLVVYRTQVVMLDVREAVNLNQAPLFHVTRESMSSLPEASLKGKVAIAAAASQRDAAELREGIEKLHPAAIVLVGSSKPSGVPQTGPNLADPAANEISIPFVQVVHAELARQIGAAKPGPMTVKLSLRIAEPARQAVTIRNIVGILRGADPVLRDTCVLLSAHYDHVGVKTAEKGDNIYNGANDNASGVAAMLEVARAAAAVSRRPRRSIVFAAFFGEESFFLGSKYYAGHPAFPLAKTVANVNLEHMGRSDSVDGDQKGRLTLTGMDYTSIGVLMQAAGRDTGVEIKKNERFNDQLYEYSDNLTFAERGVPATTVFAVAYFADYHKPSDHWEKLDYLNMEKVTRTVLLGLLRMADADEAPRWEDSNPRAARFIEAAAKLRDPARTGN